MKKNRSRIRAEKHKKIRERITGSPEKPRLSVYRSLKHIYAQVIDDVSEKTCTSASTLDKDIKDKIKFGGNIEAAKAVGELIAKRALEKKIEKVVFDRGGLRYVGRIKALAEEARKNGLVF